MRKATVTSLVLLLMATSVPAALADGVQVAEAREGIEAVTADLRGAVRHAAPPKRLPLLPEARAAFMATRLPALDETIESARVEAYETLMPIVGSTPLGDAGVALTMLFGESGRNHREILELRGLLIEWVELVDAVDTAQDVRDQIRRALGMSTQITPRACPVQGEIGFVHDWSDPRGWRPHKGIDVVAESGTPLLAIEAGTVIQADYHWAGGNGLYLKAASTGDVYYYAHMAGYAPGVAAGIEVEAGDPLGSVGSSGNADIPHLHLGWMPGSGRVDLDNLQDPYPLIVELCR